MEIGPGEKFCQRTITAKRQGKVMILALCASPYCHPSTRGISRQNLKQSLSYAPNMIYTKLRVMNRELCISPRCRLLIMKFQGKPLQDYRDQLRTKAFR